MTLKVQFALSLILFYVLYPKKDSTLFSSFTFLWGDNDHKTTEANHENHNLRLCWFRQRSRIIWTSQNCFGGCFWCRWSQALTFSHVLNGPNQYNSSFSIKITLLYWKILQNMVPMWKNGNQNYASQKSIFSPREWEKKNHWTKLSLRSLWYFTSNDFLIHYNLFLSPIYKGPLDRKTTCAMVGLFPFSFLIMIFFFYQNVCKFYTEPCDLKMGNKN